MQVRFEVKERSWEEEGGEHEGITKRGHRDTCDLPFSGKGADVNCQSCLCVFDLQQMICIPEKLKHFLQDALCTKI